MWVFENLRKFHLTVFFKKYLRVTAQKFLEVEKNNSIIQLTSWDTTFIISHVITWSRNQRVKRLNEWWPFIINLHLVKFGRHSPRGSRDISFLISHVTSCGHVITESSLPSVVVISLVEVEIWSILIFNVRLRIHMIILLQSVTIQFRRLFWHILYYKVR